MICEKAKDTLKGINNMPKYAYEYRYIVYQEDNNGCWWFWGAYSDGVRAGMVAYHIFGRVLDMETGNVYRREDLR